MTVDELRESEHLLFQRMLRAPMDLGCTIEVWGRGQRISSFPCASMDAQHDRLTPLEGRLISSGNSCQTTLDFQFRCFVFPSTWCERFPSRTRGGHAYVVPVSAG